MDKVVVFVQALFWAVLGYLGITTLSPDLQALIVPALTGFAGFVGPSIIEWQTKYRNQLSAASTVLLTVAAYAIANQHMNQKAAGLLAAICVAVAHLVNPSTAHPSRLTDPAATPNP